MLHTVAYHPCLSNDIYLRGTYFSHIDSTGSLFLFAKDIQDLVALTVKCTIHCRCLRICIGIEVQREERLQRFTYEVKLIVKDGEALTIFVDFWQWSRVKSWCKFINE